MNTPPKRRVRTLGLLALLAGIATVLWFHHSTPQFQPEPGGQYRGEISGMGAMQALILFREGSPMLEISTLLPAAKESWWLFGTNSGSRLEFDSFVTEPNQPTASARIEAAGGPVSGEFKTGNGLKTRFTLQPVCGSLGIHRTSAVMFRGKGRSFDWHGTVPDLRGNAFGTVVEERLFGDLLQREAEDREEFKPTLRETWEALRTGDPTWRWESDVQWRLHYRSTNQVSLLGLHYRYTGGAHGNTDVDTMNFRWHNGGLRTVHLRHYFHPTSPWREALVRELMTDLKRQKASFLEEKTVHTRIASETFVIDQHGLTFFFAPYEVGSYAEGIFRSLVTWTTLKPYLIVPQ